LDSQLHYENTTAKETVGGNTSMLTSTQLPTMRRTTAVPHHILGHLLVAHLTALNQFLAHRLIVLLLAPLATFPPSDRLNVKSLIISGVRIGVENQTSGLHGFIFDLHDDQKVPCYLYPDAVNIYNSSTQSRQNV